jgi:hypothetical protein
LGELLEKGPIGETDLGVISRGHARGELRIVHPRSPAAEWPTLIVLSLVVRWGAIGQDDGFGLRARVGYLGFKRVQALLRVPVLCLDLAPQGDYFQVLLPSQDRATEGGEREKSQQIVAGCGHDEGMTRIREKSIK